MNAPTRMRALATDRYGELEGLKVIEMPVPEPGAGEVRVRVVASALNPADYKVALGKVKFLHARNFPMVLVYDFSGTAEAVGRDVNDVGVGADVFGFVPYSPTNRRGAFAEAVIARVDQLAAKPQGVSHIQAAAAATPGATAIQSLRDLGRLRAGMKVVVTGVSGGVGSIGVAIAKRLGGHVVAIGSGRGLQLAPEMGADVVVDRKQDGAVNSLVGPYDVFFDAAAAYRWSGWRSRLSRGGTFITTLPSLAFVVDKLSSYLSSSRCAVAMVKSKARGFAVNRGMVERGTYCSCRPNHFLGRGPGEPGTAGTRRGAGAGGGGDWLIFSTGRTRGPRSARGPLCLWSVRADYRGRPPPPPRANPPLCSLPPSWPASPVWPRPSRASLAWKWVKARSPRWGTGPA